MFMSDRLLVPLCRLGYTLWDVFVARRDCPAAVGFDSNGVLFVQGFDVDAVCALCRSAAALTRSSSGRVSATSATIGGLYDDVKGLDGTNGVRARHCNGEYSRV